ncbi:thiol:disulfide interchange protein DsbD 1 precursor [Roseivivax marinus]|uniref:Thiol:disulfide interchange protein DsbD 1 n=1 Tax=Roseivivax marinus TaxID=1379903 RepID=W4HGT1_9RHOB|nr:protein-disulfide reductase DsbD domain-containing protein [Roseivivax marinus]ETW11210.1 thiol:disulfide interchange protein DsbD 1 precursor [Roseivivax marinus]
MLKLFRVVFALIVLGLGLTPRAQAALSDIYDSPAVTARLITAENGVAEGASTLSAGLDLQLGAGWKTYWRTPGEVGLPPRLNWSASRNVAEVDMAWPAPERFTAFGIQNFGYRDEVVFPLRIRLDAPGKPARLSVAVELLTCSKVCIPQSFTLNLDLAAGSGLDEESANRITAYSARVPIEADAAGARAFKYALDGDDLVVTARAAEPFDRPDVFPEANPAIALGEPYIRLGDGGRYLWARMPILSSPDAVPERLSLTVADHDGRAFTGTAEQLSDIPTAPFHESSTMPSWSELAWIALVAFVGGAILNVMPCVLPVLSMKLNAALKTGQSGAIHVRRSFCATAAGVMAFVWLLAALLYGLRGVGLAVGWGTQFQSPLFLAAMVLLMAVFAANMLGGFEFTLPSALQTRLARVGGARGYAGDFLTGAFSAVLATPCSAPFLGTAIAFALAGREIDIVIVFTFLGLGIASPYLAVAAAPGVVDRLPRPGKWMVWVRIFLGCTLAATALWLVWLLWGVGGVWSAALVGMLSLLLFALLVAPARGTAKGAGSIALAALVLAVGPTFGTGSSAGGEELAGPGYTWVAFDRAAIAQAVSRGEVVFVDVTADWCLTCKANKALVLDREPVRSMLDSNDVVPMQADWTRPDPRINRYLKRHDRYAIPFNAVYGPGAPNGIVLSEILTADAVVRALDTARGVSDLATAQN